MKNFENWILDVLADLIARIIMCAVSTAFIFFWIVGQAPLNLTAHWELILLISCGVGLAAGTFGIRKGPGVI